MERRLFPSRCLVCLGILNEIDKQCCIGLEIAVVRMSSLHVRDRLPTDRLQLLLLCIARVRERLHVCARFEPAGVIRAKDSQYACLWLTGMVTVPTVTVGAGGSTGSLPEHAARRSRAGIARMARRLIARSSYRSGFRYCP